MPNALVDYNILFFTLWMAIHRITDSRVHFMADALAILDHQGDIQPPELEIKFMDQRIQIEN